ncbi:hypothetical protein ACFXG4_23450 [Nocardia sp. NPDC059246]|uniref:hypothetical protein n=1 Tax=unclassified Nocardia TaxID=2637762 RepID=UPI00369EA9B7
MNNEELDKVFKKASEWVTYSWPGVIESDDLAQELWLWYLTRPSVAERFQRATRRECLQLAASHGHQIAAGIRTDNARFSNQVQYSVGDIKDALAGRSRWPEILEDITRGMEALRERNDNYADAIEKIKRPDGETMTPAERKRRERAIEALTEETNAGIRQLFDGYTPEPGKTLGDGPGSKRRVFPNDVSSKNIFDSEFNGIPGIDMYRSWVEPEMYPDEGPALVDNWSEYDREDCWNA